MGEKTDLRIRIRKVIVITVVAVCFSLGLLTAFIYQGSSLEGSAANHAIRTKTLAPETISIGVLAKQGVEKCLAQWGPTADYLDGVVPDHTFKIVPLSFEEVYGAVEKEEVDFILVNSSMYVELEILYGATRIATLKNMRLGADYIRFGGVLFTHRDRDDIHGLQDLKDMTFGAVAPNSFGGWQMAWKELLINGIDPYKDISSLEFLGTHDAVVYGVLEGQIDAGTVRSDTLERMAQGGEIDLNDFKILQPCDGTCGFPFIHSTELYPEWPMAKTDHISNDLADKVTVALMQMTAEDTAALSGKVAGWTVPQNYQTVHDTLRFLQLSPYEDYGKITLQELVIQYRYFIIIFFLLLLAITILSNRGFNLRDKVTIALEYSKEMEKKADQANEAKSQFLANMSHEIRTPMNAVIGLSELMKKTDMSDKQQDYTDKIHLSAKNLLGIINSILDYSKIEAGGMTIEESPFDLDMVLTSISNLLTIKAEEKGLELLFDIAPDIPYHLIGDSLRFSQILINLTNNALKFTPSGHIIIRMSLNNELLAKRETLPVWENPVMIDIKVIDTGIGMTEEQIENLFKPFSQADSSVSRQYGGTGLGLTIAKQLTELMHGSMQLESEPGVGTTFSFSVMFKEQQSVAKQFISPKELNGLEILVVDDNAIARDIILDIITSFGFSVTAANSGREAIELIAQKRCHPALIIMDYQMPGMTGLEAVRILRDTQSQTIPPSILMLSAYGKDEVKRDAKDLGISRFLDKPVNPSYLFDAIMQIFGVEGQTTLLEEGSQEGLSHDLDAIRGARILLAEDNDINQQVAVELLESESFSVTVAGNGAEAVELLQKSRLSPFDAVLMDIQMPIMDGRTATKIIRESSEFFSDIPIIAMTAHALSEEREKNISFGMNDHVTKPIDTKLLFSALTKWIAPKETPLVHSPTKREPQEIELPESFEGFSIEEGLTRVAGNRVLLSDLINSFCTKYQQSGIEIKDDIEKGDLQEALRSVHTLKSVSGNIGMREISEISAQIEMGLKQGESVSLLVDTLIQEVALVIHTLEGYRNRIEAQDKKRIREVDKVRFLELSEGFRELLIENDTSALDLLEPMKDCIPKIYDTMLEEIEYLVKDFSFEEAQQHIESLLTLIKGDK